MDADLTTTSSSALEPDNSLLPFRDEAIPLIAFNPDTERNL